MIMASPSLARSEGTSVNGDTLERRQIYVGQASHIDGGHFSAGAVFAVCERCGAALRAEFMLDDVLVERVRAQAFGGEQLELLARHEPKEEAFAAAMRTVALHHL